MKQIRPLFQPPQTSGSLESEPVILHDGTTASLRPIRAEDQAMMQGFIDRLSPASRRHRFFSETAPSADTIESLCDSSNPSKQLTIMVTRTVAGKPCIIAAGSYWARNADQAEVAMAVDDDFHGKGLGTILLERLAMLAIHRGFTRLWAVTHTDNATEVSESGYRSINQQAATCRSSCCTRPREHDARLELRGGIATTARSARFYPRSVAVIGASRDPSRASATGSSSPRRQPSRRHLSGELATIAGLTAPLVRHRDPRRRRSGRGLRAAR